MRAESEMPRPRPGRSPRTRRRLRALLITVVILLFVLVTSLRGIAGFYTDYLWFDSLGQSGVFTGVLGAKTVLVLLFTAVFFLLLFVNLVIADRVAPAFRPAGPEEELLERYRQIVGNRMGLVRIVVSLVFALIAGAGASSQWNEWILFRHGGNFGVEDPLFHRDVGFYVFKLPFLDYAVGWLFAALVIVLIVTGVAHYLNGGIRLQVPGPERVTPQVKVHLSVLLGLLAVVKAAGYYLDQFELTVSTRGTVDGATYTDVNAQLLALRLLILIAFGCCALFLFNIRRKGWVLPVIGIGLWAFVAVVAGAIVPAAVQRFRVEPSESSREREYIERNIAATRAALGLDEVRAVDISGEAPLTDEDLAANADIVRNIRLWDTDVLDETYQQLQALRSFYRINDVDVDRYVIDGQLTQVMISTRELFTDGVQQSSWEARHLAFTHGYGVVVSPANAKDENGRPDLAVSDIPIDDNAAIRVTEPGLYIGERQSGYVIVDTNRREIDYESDEGTEFRSYEGEDGVRIGSFLRRAAFALRFGDLNPLVSGNLTEESRILYIRDVRDRVEALAPFLEFDHDPYPVVVDGRIRWVIDAYTTTSRYPYSQRAIVDDVGGENGLDGRFNYVRHSVRAVVDAYDGSVEFFVVDGDDPIIRAYAEAFPELFTFEAPPDELAEHFRYPEELFRVQTNMWGRYHLEDPDAFYNGPTAWEVARDPGDPVAQTPVATTTTDPDAPQRTQNRIDPYYLLTRLPGEEEEKFIILRPFTPRNLTGDARPVLTAYLVADAAGGLTSYETPPTNQVDGPGIVAGTIRSVESVSRAQTELCRPGSGSTCTFGNLVFVPIGDSLLYVQPLYIVAEQNRVPLLRRVIVQFNGEVGFANTLREALIDLPQFENVPETLEEELAPEEGVDDTPGVTDEAPDASATVSDLLVEADEFFAAADLALAEGDLAGYQRNIEEAQERIARARELLAGEDNTTTSAPADVTTTTAGA